MKVVPASCKRSIPSLPVGDRDLCFENGFARFVYRVGSAGRRASYFLSFVPADSIETAVNVCKDAESIARFAGTGLVCGVGEALSVKSVEFSNYGCSLVLHVRIGDRVVRHRVKSKPARLSSKRGHDYDTLEVLADVYGLVDTVLNIFDCRALREYASRLDGHSKLFLSVIVGVPTVISNVSLENVKLRKVTSNCLSVSVIDVLGFAEKLYNSGIRLRTPVVLTGVSDRCYGTVIASTHSRTMYTVRGSSGATTVGKSQFRLYSVKNGLHLYLGGYARIMPDYEYRDPETREEALRCEARRVIVPFGMQLLDYLEKNGVIKVEEVYRVE